MTGDIVAVPVTDNQMVRAGDLLASIDPRNYQAAVELAQAQIAAAQAGVTSARAQLQAQNDQIDQAKNQIEETSAALTFSRQQNSRAQDLVKKGAGTVQAAQQTDSDLRSKTAANAAAVERWTAANGRRPHQGADPERQAQVGQGKANLATAQANLRGRNCAPPSRAASPG